MKCECGCLLEKFQLICERCGREVFEITKPKTRSERIDAVIIKDYLKNCNNNPSIAGLKSFSRM